jgi:hypothetical protein
MCGRACVAVTAGSTTTTRTCRYGEMSPADWFNVVRASMNDVDERCDVYLEAVDRARRRRDLYRKQLSDTETTTMTVLGFETGPLAHISKRTIAEISLAFGFTKGSLDNYYSRLILEVEKSSLSGLVRKRQNAYRQKLGLYITLITDKTSAYYAMRGYLRICTPPSIEAEIKATISGLRYSQTGQRTTNGDQQDPDLDILTSIPK